MIASTAPKLARHPPASDPSLEGNISFLLSLVISEHKSGQVFHGGELGHHLHFASSESLRTSPNTSTMEGLTSTPFGGSEAPAVFNVVVEITKGSKVKYELDKKTRLIKALKRKQPRAIGLMPMIDQDSLHGEPNSTICLSCIHH
ncbi:hypothetical protein J5N97_026495 [Dioscorea zingiberensis]|uniref:inorganic diphosphatase n=1 Tax=Dioscorea zingiberensis TaxID=325984 RepID=A0A9D5H6V3_9LILI|nr:hypothetical protein J5N97_026495 [Dioscorea zingiberensis]